MQRRIKANPNYAGVPAGTMGTAQKERRGTWLITWERGGGQLEEDLFTQEEYTMYLEEV